VFADLSKNLWDRESEALLLDLARATGLEAHRNAMFAGEAINTTENRAVHTCCAGLRMWLCPAMCPKQLSAWPMCTAR
jgi:glucose-6-phosphate isomerase